LQHGFSANNNGGGILFSSDALHVYDFPTSTNCSLITTALFRDASAWYHIVVQVDTTQATPSNRVRVYVNGVPITIFSTATYPGINTVFRMVASGNSGSVGRYFDGANYFFDGYLTDVNFIDGQALTPASFGAIDSSTGVWAPRPYSGTYGTNGFYLKFGNTSSVAALGTDSSGNNNTWTVNNVSLTAGATYDSMIDVPVNYADGGNGRGNYCTLNAIQDTGTLTGGNLRFSGTGGGYSGRKSTIQIPSTGKWYWETNVTTQNTGAGNWFIVGMCTGSLSLSAYSQANANSITYGDRNDIRNITNGVATVTNNATIDFSTGAVLQCAFDADTGKFWFGRDNAWWDSSAGTSGNPSAGTNQTLTAATNEWFPYVQMNEALNVADLNFGQRPFTYTPPAGFRALNTNNLPTPSIVNGANFMAATTYTGTAGVQSILNAVNSVSFQPDLVWIKSRTPGATSHALFDSTRGTGKYLSSDTTAAETTNANSLTAFNGDGFSLGTDTTIVNANANSYIAWQWRESIIAGLDVVSYAGTGVNRTVAHNLGVAPAMIIVKRSQTGATSNWQVRHTSIAAANSIQLNLPNQAAAAATVWNSTAPTSSVFSLGTSTDVNASGISYVAYCFAQIAGFSRFGSYTGNGLADGPFVFCGFRPRFVMVKRTDVANNWLMFDTSRDTFNQTVRRLFADLANAEDSGGDGIDFLSNGFKLRVGASAITNASGGTYIFAAFAEVPSKYALAR
jgi:hypothetical protein